MTRYLAVVVFFLSGFGLTGLTQAQLAPTPPAILSPPGTQVPVPRRANASARQVQDFLKANPELQTGIKLPDGATAKALRAIPGGVRYQVEGASQAEVIIVDVKGPPQVLARSFLEITWEGVKKAVAATNEILGAIPGAGSSTQKGCTNVNVDGGGKVVIVSTGQDSKRMCEGME